MRKLWVLALKEVLLTFRDIEALVTMLVTPLALTLVMMAAFGTGDSTPLADIPVLLLNHDEGTLSESLVDVFAIDEVADLVALEIVTDEAAARARVEEDEVAALVIIPPDFNERAFPFGALAQDITGLDITTLTPDAELTPEQQAGFAQAFTQSQASLDRDPTVIEIYASPDWRISAAVVKGILSQGLEMMNIQIVGITNVMSKLARAQMQTGGAATDFAPMMQTAPSDMDSDTQLSDLPVKLHMTSSSGRRFSWLGYYASSMAVLFLMFAVTSGGRTLLAERQRGSLPRLLVTPTPALTILIGKMGGIVLTGILQIIVLWGATSLIGAYWGNPLGVLITIIVVVLCASSVGAVISAWSRSASEAGAIGTAISLVGGALSGSFFVRWNLPMWVQYVSLITPNAWGIETFSRLQAGKNVLSILPWLGGTLLVTIIYYGIAMVGFRRQFD